MRGTRLRFGISVLGGLVAFLMSAGIHPTCARAAMALYQDPRTGAVYTKKCRTCIFMGSFVPAPQIEQSVTQQTQTQIDTERAQMQAQFTQQQAQQQQWNAEMAQQVSAMQPAWRDYADRWYKKISFGTLIYADYRYMTHTGFGPQFLTQETWPGEGNNGFNSFDITRAYLDFRFTPDENFMARVTPNIYESISGSGGSAIADKYGNNTGVGQTVDGNLSYRLKYAYIDYQTFFKKILKVAAMRDDKITFGQQQNPLVDWEENLWGYRYTSLTPWNYLSLSSTQVGLAVKGPIKFREKQWADYDVGVYDDASFHATEQSANKQVMGRLTVNPFGARTRYDSLGITGFWDYGYPNKAPDGQFTGLPPAFGGSPIANTTSAYGHMTRVAGLLHYTGETWGLIGEFDYGHNAFSANNLFSGSGPADNFTGLSSITNPLISYATWTKMVQFYQNASTSVQIGWDFLGHVDIPRTPFTFFGLYQQLQPNMQVSRNPLDFYRFDLGVQWLISKNLRIALDDQHLSFYHGEITTTTADLLRFGPTKPIAPITSSVPRDTNMIMLNVEFKY